MADEYQPTSVATHTVGDPPPSGAPNNSCSAVHEIEQAVFDRAHHSHGRYWSNSEIHTWRYLTVPHRLRRHIVSFVSLIDLPSKHCMSAGIEWGGWVSTYFRNNTHRRWSTPLRRPHAIPGLQDPRAGRISPNLNYHTLIHKVFTLVDRWDSTISVVDKLCSSKPHDVIEDSSH